jgi:hypothetical protein
MLKGRIGSLFRTPDSEHGGGGRPVTTKRPSGRVSDAVPAAMARIATSVAEAVSVPVSLLGGYLER